MLTKSKVHNERQIKKLSEEKKENEKKIDELNDDMEKKDKELEDAENDMTEQKKAYSDLEYENQQTIRTLNALQQRFLYFSRTIIRCISYKQNRNFYHLIYLFKIKMID